MLIPKEQKLLIGVLPSTYMIGWGALARVNQPAINKSICSVHVGFHPYSQALLCSPTLAYYFPRSIYISRTRVPLGSHYGAIKNIFHFQRAMGFAALATLEMCADIDLSIVILTPFFFNPVLYVQTCTEDILLFIYS